jgi:hypothetical protein
MADPGFVSSVGLARRPRSDTLPSLVEVAWLGCAATAVSWADRRGLRGAWHRPTQLEFVVLVVVAVAQRRPG